ncbi:hypothetical protein WSM22_47530 [Cytophagales bacterium WSM2-2]|nr:hypothetical protein WSM22_47530 [Cytophagales bacterium WSM2-2]
MKIIPAAPGNSLLKSLIETYLFVSTEKPLEATTIPNGRVDATIILKGRIEWFYQKQKKFKTLPACCFYPLTNSINPARSNSFQCISIKFYPHILTLLPFRDKEFEEPVDFRFFFKSDAHEAGLLKNLRKASDIKKQTTILDSYLMSRLFSSQEMSSWLQEVNHLIDSRDPEKISIDTIARSLGISVKTLERKFISTVGLTPKQYIRIVQFQKTAIDIRKSDLLTHGDMTKSLDNGYYDQSHFVKVCKKITGMTPKEFFVRLPKGMTDVMLS